MPKASVIIPSLGRSDALYDCKESLYRQTEQDFEIIVVTEEGPLAKLRNEGARRAKGEILIFIDDDVVTSPGWMEAILRRFSDKSIGGVSGPAVITGKFRGNRDLFKYRSIKWLYDLIFLEGRSHLPGHFMRSGAWTTGAANEDCNYEGEVHFLEACNSAYRREVFESVGGFDESYRGVGDWSEPDLSFRVRRAGYKLWFSRDARLEHRPSCSGAFKKRKSDSRNRMDNYELFSKRWIEPCWQHTAYKWFMRTYYAIKTLK